MKLSKIFSKTSKLLFPLMLVFFLSACKKEDAAQLPGNRPDALSPVPLLPEVPFDYAGIELPSHFQTNALSLYESFANPVDVSNEGAALGRVLFL
jgi:hypothetical protein